MAKATERRPCPQRGKRYDAKLKRAVVRWAVEHGSAAAVSKFGVSARSLCRWTKAHRESAPGSSTPSSRGGGDREPGHSGSRVPRRGRRYGVAEKQEVLAYAKQHGVTAAAQQFGVSRWSIYDWRHKTNGASPQAAKKALQPASSRPKRNARSLSQERYHLIAETWKQNQALGPRQVRNQLRRTHALRVGTSTVRRVMVEQGYVPPKIRVERRVARRYEAVRPNQQHHLDFLHFFVHKAKCFLLLIEDDYSRFLPGWALCEGERAQPVIEAVDAAIARHGKPEQMVVDGGSGFFSWRGQSQLERVCGDYGIDFIKASKGGANAKIEALNANVRKELLSRVELNDLVDARIRIAQWVHSYNFERVHEGLGGLLVPADRYLGRVDAVLAQLERGEPVVVPGPLSPDDRALELFRVISRGGRPELWLLGDRIWPAAAPS